MAAKKKASKPKEKKVKEMKGQTLADSPPVKEKNTRGASNPKKVAPAKKKPAKKKSLAPVKFVSVDNRVLEAYVNRQRFEGKKVIVPGELKEEVSRLLKAGGYYFKIVKVKKNETQEETA